MCNKQKNWAKVNGIYNTFYLLAERRNDKENRGSKSMETAMKLYQDEYNLFLGLTWSKKEWIENENGKGKENN